MKREQNKMRIQSIIQMIVNKYQKILNTKAKVKSNWKRYQNYSLYLKTLNYYKIYNFF